MIKTTRQKIYNFSKPTAVYCQIATFILSGIYLTHYKGIKLKIKSVEAIIENNVSYPLQLLSSKQIKSFVFTTEHGKIEIQLVDQNGNLPYIHSSSLPARVICLSVKVENFIVKEVKQVKSDDSLKKIYLATLLNKATLPFIIDGNVIPTNIPANKSRHLR